MKRTVLWLAVMLAVALLVSLPVLAEETVPATEIALGTDYTGELGGECLESYYRFTLPTSGTLNIKVLSTMGGTWYRIYDESLSKVFEGVYSNGLEEKTELIAGTYYFYVARDQSDGRYTFRLDFTSAEESFGESFGATLNTLESAPVFETETAYRGHFAVNDLSDYYKFTLPASGRLQINVKTTMANTYYRIYNESNVLIWGGLFAHGLDVSAELTAGTYYFYAEAYEGLGAYTFMLSHTSAAESIAESVGALLNSIERAPVIETGNTYKGHISLNDEADYYRFTLPASGTLSIAAVTTMGQTDYHIYNESNVFVWGGGYSNGMMGEAELSAGTYYFRVGRVDGMGAYSLILNFAPVSESFSESVGGNLNSIERAPVIETGKPYTGHLSLSDDADFYKFTIPESGRIGLKVMTVMGDTAYAIYDESNVAVWSGTYANGASQNVDLVAGVYYFTVTRGASLGSYSFSLSYTSAKETHAETFLRKNNSRSNADSILINKIYRGQLAINDTVDVYCFTVSAPTVVRMRVSADMGDTYYRIFDMNEQTVTELTTSGNSESYDLELSPGTYYFHVGKQGGTGAYSFSVSEIHTCAGEYQTVIPPTCMETGLKGLVCGICGGISESEVLPAAGHTGDNWTVITAPTCTTKGLRHGTCSVCLLEVDEALDEVPHTFGEWVIDEAAECESTGVRSRVCSSCAQADAEEIPALGHSMGEWTVIWGNRIIPPIIREQVCATCEMSTRTEDWSYSWIGVIAAVVLIGLIVGTVSYIRAFKRK